MELRPYQQEARAAEVNGGSQDRAEVLRDFEAGKYNVLCNSMLLTEGWDCPSVDCVAVLRPTRVRSLYSQMVGRGTRLSPGKASLLLDRLEKRRSEGLTTPKQIRCLERYGFRHVGQWPMEAAAHMIDRIAAMGWRGVPRGVDPAAYQPEV